VVTSSCEGKISVVGREGEPSNPSHLNGSLPSGTMMPSSQIPTSHFSQFCHFLFKIEKNPLDPIARCPWVRRQSSCCVSVAAARERSRLHQHCSIFEPHGYFVEVARRIPCSLFSWWSPGYPNGWTGEVLSSSSLLDIYEGMHRNQLSRYDFVLSGYIGNKDTLRSLLTIVRKLRLEVSCFSEMPNFVNSYLRMKNCYSSVIL
jgi:hypothetical protein